MIIDFVCGGNSDFLTGSGRLVGLSTHDDCNYKYSSIATVSGVIQLIVLPQINSMIMPAIALAELNRDVKRAMIIQCFELC